MVQPKPVRRDRDRLPVWLQRCRAVFRGRALAIATPLALTLVFGIVYSLHDASYVNQNASGKVTSVVHRLSGTKSPASNLALDKASSSAAQNAPQTGPSVTPTAPSQSSNASASAGKTATGTPNQVLGAATVVCDTAAKALAISTNQAAIAAENLRHSKLVSQLKSNGLLSTLLEKTNLATEATLHALKLQNIADTYTQSLRAANCL